MVKGLRVVYKQLLFISAIILLTLFPFPAIVLKVLMNTAKYLLTGEFSAEY